MSVDHLVMYQKMTSNKKYGEQLPDWVYQEKFNFPAHPKRSELIGQYKQAKQQHDEWVEVLQSKWRDPDILKVLNLSSSANSRYRRCSRVSILWQVKFLSRRQGRSILSG